MEIHSAAHGARQGFIDRLLVLSRLRNFAQPSEVGQPIELLRAGVAFHARGLINTVAIPCDAFVIGHVGRLTPEKNLSFLAEQLQVSLKPACHPFFGHRRRPC